MGEQSRDARSVGCNQGEKLHVAVVIQVCIHVAVVIHTCLFLPPAMTLGEGKVRVSKTVIGSSVGDRIIKILLNASVLSWTTIPTKTYSWGSTTADVQIKTQRQTLTHAYSLVPDNRLE